MLAGGRFQAMRLEKERPEAIPQTDYEVPAGDEGVTNGEAEIRPAVMPTADQGR